MQDRESGNGLSPERLRLLRALHSSTAKADARVVGAPPPIRRRNSTEPVTATPAQQALWFIDRLAGADGSNVYNIGQAFRLYGNLDHAALERGFGIILQRHEVLRTIFPEVDGLPVQVVAEPALAFTASDLAHLPLPERETALARLTSKAVRHPFNLATGPLFRVHLIRLGDSEWVLMFVVHHIVFDAVSAGVLMRELSVLYRAAPSQAEPYLSDLPVQYADYAVWQQEYLRGKVRDELLAYWRTQLAGAPPVLQIPHSRPSPPGQAAGDSYRFRLPQPAGGELLEFGRACGATPFMVLLALFTVLLSQLTGQADLCVGSPVANRARPELGSLIGYFVNMVVLRTDLAGDPSFREVLRRVRETCLGAFDHQQLPFSRLVEELRPDRSSGRNPLFEVVYMMESSDEPAVLSLGDLDVVPYELPAWEAKFDFILSFESSQGCISGTFGYRSDLYDTLFVQHMAGDLCDLAMTVSRAPDTKLSQLPTGNSRRTAGRSPDGVSLRRRYRIDA